MTKRALPVLLLCLTCLLGCASTQPTERIPLELFALRGSDGRSHELSRAIAENTLTVFVFYSESCPCVSAHEPRLKQIFEDYRGQGVQLFLVNSELGADPDSDAREALRRAYPFVLLTDPEARLARSVGAEFATHTIVVDAQGLIRYSGGVDSDMVRLKPDATPHLRNALDELLAGRTPEASGRALGCTLQLY